MVVRKITIAHLYPRQMNVYGDMGNIVTLRYRLESRGITVKYQAVESLAKLKEVAPDILVGGGGQDSNQESIQGDLKRHKSEITAFAEDGVVALMICGMYQLFGKEFVLPDGRVLPGLGVIDMVTRAGDTRMIGNIVIDSKYGPLVGFENHSGKTYLADTVSPLGKVSKGFGNNGETLDEGAVVKNVFGSYMHGPALAKNPLLADELIRRALDRKYGIKELTQLDDYLEEMAASRAIKRPR